MKERESEREREVKCAQSKERSFPQIMGRVRVKKGGGRARFHL